MPYANFSGKEIIKALRSNGFHPVRREGSHVTLRYENPETDEVRNVQVPMSNADEISQNTYRSIATQCGASEFGKWCDWIRENC